MRAALPLLAGLFLISACADDTPGPTAVDYAPTPYYGGSASPVAAAAGPIACDGPYLQDYSEHPPLSSCPPDRQVRLNP